MKEIWERWTPIELDKNMYKASYVQLIDFEGLEIHLVFNDTENLLNIKFVHPVLAYQNIDEGRRLKTLEYLSENYDSQFFTDWTLFEVKNSSYLTWFHTESFGINEDEKVFHYVILTENDVVDILSLYKPRIEITHR
ncbi:hypothetical protein [Enterococcus hulanensis]|uniref:hypothetical protein n=1 Tax=Enterococcus hulanensis TaxID=2559929 RepID=UPI0010F5137D|nr:hypothetical protein [Enterococcus hulanensis]